MPSAIDMQGMSQKQLERTKNTLEKVKTKLEDYQKHKNKTVNDLVLQTLVKVVEAGEQKF